MCRVVCPLQCRDDSPRVVLDTSSDTSMLLPLLIRETANRLFIGAASSVNFYPVIDARCETIRRKIGTLCLIKIFPTINYAHKTQCSLFVRKPAIAIVIVIIAWRRRRRRCDQYALIRNSSRGREGLTIEVPGRTIGRSDCITDYLPRDGCALITISRYLSHLSHMRSLVYTKLSITRILRETRLVSPLVGRLFGRKSSRNRPASRH